MRLTSAADLVCYFIIHLHGWLGAHALENQLFCVIEVALNVASYVRE